MINMNHYLDPQLLILKFGESIYYHQGFSFGGVLVPFCFNYCFPGIVDGLKMSHYPSCIKAPPWILSKASMWTWRTSTQSRFIILIAFVRTFSKVQSHTVLELIISQVLQHSTWAHLLLGLFLVFWKVINTFFSTQLLFNLLKT